MRIIAGEARGRRIEAPAGRDTRPTLDRVRENLFNMLQGEIEGRKILDLFAGSACLADHDRKAIAAERRNAEAIGYQDRIRIFPTDWRKALKELERDGACFDIVFLDPPYAMLALGEVFSELRSVIDRDTLIILEHEAGKTPETGEGFVRVKETSWGFCGVTIYRMEENGEGGERL